MNYATQILWKQLILEEQLSRIGGIEEPNVLPTISSPKVWEYRDRIQVHKRGAKIGFLERESDNVVDVDRCPIANQIVNEKLLNVRSKWPTDSDRLGISKDESSSFAQVNPYINESLKKLVVDWAKNGPLDNVLELYAGSGNLTLPLSKVAEKIVAVESDRVAAESILRQAQDERIECEERDGYVEAKSVTVEEYFVYPSQPPLTKGRSNFDLILLDPPRDGLSKEAIEGIIKLQPKRILYVSCNPSTLARDVKLLKKSGWVLLRTQPLDMFPQTYHIESISEIVR